MNSRIIQNPDCWQKLRQFIKGRSYSMVFVLCDKNTARYCYPVIKSKLPIHERIIISAGEKNKSLQSAGFIWNQLTERGTGKDSLLINLGGGMVTDTGGFAASVYKRGIDVVNIPTTLLAQCDAAIGGKTALDFKNIKNIIGSFHFPVAVLIEPAFLKTLDKRTLLSGFAEMIKTAIIADKKLFRKLSNTEIIPQQLQPLVSRAVRIKQNILKQDPFDLKTRQALNFGHTAGHAFESLMATRKDYLLHGEAIALGMVAESFIALNKSLITVKELNQITDLISHHFELPHIAEADFDKLFSLMKQDKKNRKQEIRMALPEGIGKVKINTKVQPDIIYSAFQYCNFALHS
ncbi:MAG: 3-dehydroquinate synthase [Bacteroidia bacterium]|nr:3-dehydroquinate synthase [Bacteroidia bacterium]MCZ2277463.1 3-dehydroquinate synthase [Bacteroidia bacterium]